MDRKELTAKEAAEHIGRRLWEMLEKNKDVSSAAADELTQHSHSKDCKHPINKRYYKYDGVSHRQALCCRRCGQMIVSFR